MIDALRRRLVEEGSVTVDVRARPNAHQSRIVGVLADGSVKVDLAAAPEGGTANEELIGLFARSFGLPRLSVTLVSGQSARRKRLRITQQ